MLLLEKYESLTNEFKKLGANSKSPKELAENDLIITFLRL